MRRTRDDINSLSSLQRPFARALWVAPFIAFFSGSAAMGVTVLDFEDFPSGTKLTAQYGPRGVLFFGAFLHTDLGAHSGSRVVQSVNPSDFEQDPGPLVIAFTSEQHRVKLFAGVTVGAPDCVLKAFDGNGALVAQDGPKPVTGGAFNTAFEVTTATDVILRVEFLLVGGGFENIDDLEFDGKPPATVPTTPPVVAILAPANGVDRDLNEVDVAGTVTGDGLLSPVTMTMTSLRPPEQSSAPPFTSAIELTGTGTTRQFALPIFGPAPLGPITITVTAENIGALKGTATSTFTNLPAQIVQRFNNSGGTATFGAFRFGLFLDGCKVAVYEQGAISTDGTQATLVIRGQIFTKWLSLKGPFNSETGFFGCPKDEEHDTTTIFAGARVQNFTGGRIYTGLLIGLEARTVYVPAVFVDVMTKRGDEQDVGLPLADPTDSIGPKQTWLFQRFFKPDEADLLPSTMEIRGSPPILWLERQAGRWLERREGILTGTFLPSAFDQATHKNGATIWEPMGQHMGPAGEDVPCSGNLGPCTVGPEINFGLPENNPEVGDKFCNGTTYIPTLEGVCSIPSGTPGISIPIPCIPPEWVSIRGHYDVTPVFGAIVSAHMTDIDNGFTHETHNATCPYLGDGLAVGVIVGGLLGGPGGVAVAVGGFVAAEEYGLTCVSDFEFFVRLIGPQIDTSGFGTADFKMRSLLGKENTKSIKTEYEVAYAAAAHNFLGAPAVGDLVHTTGRWIADCGHDTYKTELHPIFSFARMKTVVSETNTFTGLEEDLFGGTPATRIAIWINGWYPGGDGNEIEFDIFPPPRPSAESLLHVVKPVDFAAGGYQAAEDVSLEFAFAPAGTAGHVHLRFSAPRRENTVTSAGEMKFNSGRQYWGIWYLYWGQ